MYYVYRYTDQTTGEVMYIGKGKGDRAYDHLKPPTRGRQTRFKNKVEALKRAHTPPVVDILVDNIHDEQEAYRLEEQYIRFYGRKGYEEYGTLLNTCESSKPPNHRGKSYKEIYGDDWQQQIEKRRQTQLAVGGFGPKQHTSETKEKIRKSSTGRQANANQIENSRLMGLKNKGRVRVKKECSHCKRMIGVNAYEQHTRTHLKCTL